MTDRNKNKGRGKQNGRVSNYLLISMFSEGLLTSEPPYQDRAMSGKHCHFQSTLPTSSEDPTILQLNIEGLTASKMKVLHYLALQLEALVILLQETNCTTAKKLVFPGLQLAGSSFSRKHGLVTFVYERIRYTLLNQSPPISEIAWLCVDVDNYKIVNVYKPPPARLQFLDFPVFSHLCLYARDFNCRHVDWGYDNNSLDGVLGWLNKY